MSSTLHYTVHSTTESRSSALHYHLFRRRQRLPEGLPSRVVHGNPRRSFVMILFDLSSTKQLLEANPSAHLSCIDANFPSCRFGRNLLPCPSKTCQTSVEPPCRVAGVGCLADPNCDSSQIRPLLPPGAAWLANEALAWREPTRRPRGNPALSNKGASDLTVHTLLIICPIKPSMVRGGRTAPAGISYCLFHGLALMLVTEPAPNLRVERCQDPTLH